MENEKVYTRTKDRVLIDQVYESPVDQSTHAIRKKLMWIALFGLFILFIFCLMK